MHSLTESSDKLRNLLRAISEELIERETLIQLIVLSAVAREHLLVLGAPGTAKSAAVRAVAAAFDGEYFEYLLGRFTEPSELFGPVDLRKLRDGVVETETRGMLPEADIAFLDEVFLGSTAILNTLLGVLNERTFKRGHTRIQCPLQVCVAASNHLPDDEALAAFADRFLVRLHVDPLPDSQLESLLTAGWAREQARRELPRMSLAELAYLADAARQVDLSEIQPVLAQCIRLLRQGGIQLSDRRIVKSQNLVAASAVLSGKLVATAADLWPLIYVIPTPDAQQHARELLQDVLAASQHAVLPHAVDQASNGALARAGRLLVAAEAVVQARPDEEVLLDMWRLRAESILREIDAGFPEHRLPETLSTVRQQLAEQLTRVSA